MVGIAASAADDLSVRRMRVGGGPGALVYEHGRLRGAWSFHVVNGQIHNMYVVLNPKKLAHLTAEAPREEGKSA